MKTNPENIPAHIYDWISEYSFEQLNAAQQTEVLRYLEATEYNALHGPAAKLSTFNSMSPANGKETRKKALLQHFDQHHAGRKGAVFFLNRPVALWKAAAAIVVLLAGWVFFYLDEKPEIKKELVATVDTVYVTKEIPVEPLKIYDTIYVTKYREGNPKKENVHSNGTSPNGNMGSGSHEKVNVLSVKELESTPNQPRGNSMKDDTLLKKFSFVTM